MMATTKGRLWVSRLKETTPLDMIVSALTSNASKVKRATLLAGGFAAVTFQSEQGAAAVRQDVKKIDGRQISMETYEDSKFLALIPDKVAKISVDREQAAPLFDQEKRGLLLLARKHNIFWTEDTQEGLQLYCNPSHANSVLGEINNMRKAYSGPKSTSVRFGMALGQNAMGRGVIDAANAAGPETNKTANGRPNGNSQRQVPMPLSPAQAPPNGDAEHLAACMVTRMTVADADAVQKMAAASPGRVMGGMEIGIHDDLLVYISKKKSDVLNKIESKFGVSVQKSAGKVNLALKPGNTNRESVALAYSDFLSMYEEIQNTVKFLRMDLKAKGLSGSGAEALIRKLEGASPGVVVRNNYAADGTAVVIGPEEDLRKALQNVPSAGQAAVVTQQVGAVPESFQKEIKGKAGYSYFGGLAEMNVKKVYTYKESSSGMSISLKCGSIAEEEVDAAVVLCDANASRDYATVRAILDAAGEMVQREVENHILTTGPMAVGGIAVTGPGSLKMKHVLLVCVEETGSATWTKSDLQTGITNGLLSGNELKLRSLAVLPLKTKVTSTCTNDFAESFCKAVKSFTSSAVRQGTVREVRVVDRDALAIDLLSGDFDAQFTRTSGPLSAKGRNTTGPSPVRVGTQGTWGSRLKQLASPESK